jgi:pyruvate/2-oxoglutarate dehydrogenase complex dihydrolipoamide acyltransferase (E2) component
MAVVEVAVPKLGWHTTEGYLVEWLVADGATVSAGDPLYTLESEKTEQVIEAPAPGVVRIKAEPDEAYPVGHVIAEIDQA